MATIRKMRNDEIADIEYICRMTAGPECARNPVVGNLIAKMFSTYYARECYDTSFVLADENDKPVGYLLCEPNYKRFNKLFRKIDVPQIFKLKKRSGMRAWTFPIPYNLLGKKYPAHLHIDLLPEYQSKGYGAKMIEMLLDELKSRNVKGIMLMADVNNTGAVRFYTRLGFKTLLSKFGTVVMVKNIS